MNLKDRRAAAIKAAQDIIGKAQAERRDLTSEERATLAAKNAEVTDLTWKIDRSEADAELMKSLEGLGDPGEFEARGESTVSLSFKGVTDRLLRTADGGPRNIKALLAAGSQAVETTETGLLVVKERPAETVMDLVPAEKVAENFSYLRQTVRTNNAAPVAVGALKPTSVFTLAREEGRLKVVAHLSEPIPEYWLKDAPALKQFVQNEMIAGLAEAVVEQFLNGDGVGENLNGVTVASGVQTQVFETDMITTARYGLGALETLGMVGGFYVLNPTDWLAIETTRSTTNGDFLMSTTGSPIDSVRRQLWGVPVALSNNVTAGVGYAFAPDAAMLFHDGVVVVGWGTVGDDFGRNQVRCRVEGRFEAGAIRPAGIVEMDLTAGV